MKNINSCRGDLLRCKISALVLSALIFQSCTTARLVNNPVLRDCPSGSKNLCHKETHWVYFWGLVNDKEFIAGCEDPNITMVEYKSNYAFTAISFLTLGIITPQQVEWNCGVANPAVDEI